tara:strand:- start:309 stop:566 length:258 start_codon:yes stop_codon:yes gene_type:complete
MKPLFQEQGAINNLFNDFAAFLLTRKSLSEATEKKFVKKLQSLSGLTNSASSLLQKRIDKQEINHNGAVSYMIIREMEGVIKTHS